MDADGSKRIEMVRGGMYGRRDPRSWAQRQAALELRERLVAAMAGQRKSRMLGCVQAGVTNPTKAPVKLMGELKAARVTHTASYEIVIAPLVRALNRLHGKDDQHAA